MLFAGDTLLKCNCVVGQNTKEILV